MTTMMFNRRAQAVWTGDIPTGGGTITFNSKAIPPVGYSAGTRFGDLPGSNPEELLAGAHAACYSMAFTAFLGTSGHPSASIDTKALCTIEQVETGFKITKIRLQVVGTVPGLTQEQFASYAHEAEKTCPVSNALRNNVEIIVEPTLAT